jgi:predicted kinase
VAPEAELRRRLRERIARGGDASEAGEAVLDDQLQHAEPLDAAERAEAITVDPDVAGDPAAFAANLAKRLRRRA